MKSLIFTLVTAILVLSFAIFAQADITSGLVLYMPFDEGSGKVANDSSGNNHQGKIEKAEWTDGKFGKGLQFNGKDSFVEIPYADDFNITEGITLGAWVMANVPFDPVWRGIINARKTNYGPYLLQTGSGSVGEVGIYFAAAWTYVQTVKPLEKGVFHHLVGTYDQKDGYHIYFDGELNDGAGSAGAKKGPIDENVDEGVMIGHNYGLAGRFWDGIIDEVVIYNRALSVDEIGQLFKEPLAKFMAVDSHNKLATTWGGLKDR